ncbi:MAG TPA: restriction endonuclease subunit S [Bacteroidales bacterium]|nr:restriction endonuclease subunit S [Bacteroidales bacterium]
MTKQQNIPSGYNPDSYRDSPLGQIPSDWEVMELNNIADVRDGTHESPCYYENGVIFITSKNIKNGELDFSDITYISKEDAENINKRSKVERGDILMSMIGTIGNCVLVDFEPNFCIKNVGLIKPQNIDKYFLIQFFYSPIFQNYLIRNLDGGIQKFISLGGLRELKLPIPIKIEQRAIAACLSNWDNAITKVQAILAQRELRKKWLMQNLLTGKKRLKGFDGEWKEYKLEYFIEEYNEKPKDGNKYEVLTSAKSGLMKQTDYYGDNRITNREDADYNIIPPNYITYRSRSDDGLFTFNKNTLGFTGLISGYYPVFTIKNGDIDFILMYCNYYRQKLTQYSIGTSQLVLSINALKSASFILPFTEEQTAIAQVLRAADKEIQLLKNKLEKLKEQKKGLMQVLLTGKKRLAVKN